MSDPDVYTTSFQWEHIRATTPSSFRHVAHTSPAGHSTWLKAASKENRVCARVRKVAAKLNCLIVTSPRRPQLECSVCGPRRNNIHLHSFPLADAASMPNWVVRNFVALRPGVGNSVTSIRFEGFEGDFTGMPLEVETRQLCIAAEYACRRPHGHQLIVPTELLTPFFLGGQNFLPSTGFCEPTASLPPAKTRDSHCLMAGCAKRQVCGKSRGSFVLVVDGDFLRMQRLSAIKWQLWSKVSGTIRARLNGQ